MNDGIVKKAENSQVSIFKEQLAIAQDYADAVVNSMYGKLFETLIPDPANPDKQIKVIKKEDIVACILLGRELGLSDMVSISFGKTLDKTAYFKVMKGKSLGMDTISSLQHVFTYEKEGQMIIGMDTHFINATILKAGINYKFVKDFERKVYYRDKNNVFLGYILDENWIIINRGIKPEGLKAALEQGKFPVKEEFTFESSAIFYRKGWEPHIETYSLLDATQAGLYQGFDLLGNEIKGKPAWNANPKSIMNGRVITIAGRKIAGDALNGLYSLDEINDGEVTKATIVESNATEINYEEQTNS
jgi:hypothetical protein